jgi:hypothetical protein
VRVTATSKSCRSVCKVSPRIRVLHKARCVSCGRVGWKLGFEPIRKYVDRWDRVQRVGAQPDPSPEAKLLRTQATGSAVDISTLNGRARWQDQRWSAVEFKNNSRTETPKHDVEPTSTTHQKAGPAVKKGNPPKSAKPPSPVQIRAAPPKSLRNSRDWVCACVRGRFLIAPKSPRVRSLLRRATSVNHCIATSCQRAIPAGEEVRRTSTLSRVVMVSRLQQ